VPSSISATEQQLLGRIGGYKSWANTEDRTTRTAPGRAAFLARFDDAADPEAARKAYFAELSLKAARAQPRRRPGAQRAEWLEEYDRVRAIPLKPVVLPPVPGAWRKPVSEFLSPGSSKRNSDTRTCGVLRFGRKNGDRTFIYRMKCGQRTCASCRQKVIAAKVDPLPERLYALEIERESWPHVLTVASADGAPAVPLATTPAFRSTPRGS
jgi:hypothetical protein